MPETVRDRQRRHALKKANAVRLQRKNLKALVKSGEVDAIALIRGENAEWEPIVLDWPLSQVLRMVPGVGQMVELEVYNEGNFGPSLKLSALSDSRRDQLADLCKEARRGWRRSL